MSLNSKRRYAMFPEAYKAGVLASQIPTSTVGDFTVVRTTTSGNGATRVNKEGFIEQVPDNVPRLDYSDGGCPKLLTEASSENLITYSEDFSDGSWNKSSVNITPNEDISPSGGNNATRLSISSAGGNLFKQPNIIGTGMVISFYVKSNGASKDNFVLRLGSGAGSTSQILTATNEWVRYSFYKESIDANVAGIRNVIGEEVDILIFGAQLEQKPQATSYIPTNGSTEQRGTETIANAGDASTFNSVSGVLFADFKHNESNDFSTISLSDGTTTNRVYLGKNSVNQMRMLIAGSGNISTIDFNYDFELQNKVAGIYDSNQTLYINGIKIETKTSPNIVGLNSAQFNSGAGSSLMNGKTKSVQHFDYLTDEEMEKLTGYDSYDQMVSQFNFTTL